MNFDDAVQSIDPTNPFAPLVVRFGEAAVTYWIQLLGEMHRLTLGGVVAASRSINEAVMPDAVMLVMRFPSDDPEGLVGTLGWTMLGPPDVGVKKAVLTRALESLETEPEMFTQAARRQPAPKLELKVVPDVVEAEVPTEDLTATESTTAHEAVPPPEIAG